MIFTDYRKVTRTIFVLRLLGTRMIACIQAFYNDVTD